jgi:DNA-binding NarL/FixJ family response regulator
MGQVVRLMLADAHPAFADGLGMILAAEDDFTVCGVVHDGCMVVELSAAQRPAVLLLDVNLAGGDGATMPAAVKAASPTTKVLLLLSAPCPSNAVAAATTAGADGVVAKEGSSQQLANAIRQVVDGKRAIVAGGGSRRPHDNGMEVRLWTLSDRELEVLGLLARGWSNRRIAQAWHVSLATVRSHVQNLLEKLDLHTKLEAAAFAWEHGIVAGDGMARGERQPPPDPTPAPGQVTRRARHSS